MTKVEPKDVFHLEGASKMAYEHVASHKNVPGMGELSMPDKEIGEPANEKEEALPPAKRGKLDVSPPKFPGVANQKEEALPKA